MNSGSLYFILMKIIVNTLPSLQAVGMPLNISPHPVCWALIKIGIRREERLYTFHINNQTHIHDYFNINYIHNGLKTTQYSLILRINGGKVENIRIRCVFGWGLGLLEK